VKSLRVRYASGALQKNQPKNVERLNEVGIKWENEDDKKLPRKVQHLDELDVTLSDKKKHHEDLFQKKLALLSAFKEEHGHCDVPDDHPRLGRWVKSLRVRYASGGLQKNQPKNVERLNEVGIKWENEDDKKLPRKVQHLDGLDVSSTKNPTTANEATSTSKMTPNRNFQKKLALLCAFKDENGHLNVPKDHPELGRWVKLLRSRYASGELQKTYPGVMDKLTTLGFVWDHQKGIDTTSSVGKTKIGRNLDSKNHRGNGPGKKMKMLKDSKKKTGSNCDVSTLPTSSAN